MMFPRWRAEGTPSNSTPADAYFISIDHPCPDLITGINTLVSSIVFWILKSVDANKETFPRLECVETAVRMGVVLNEMLCYFLRIAAARHGNVNVILAVVVWFSSLGIDEIEESVEMLEYVGGCRGVGDNCLRLW